MGEEDENAVKLAKGQVLFWLFEYCVKCKFHLLCDEIFEEFVREKIVPILLWGENNTRSFTIYLRYLQILLSKDMRKRENLMELFEQIENSLKYQPFQKCHKFYKILIQLQTKIKLLLVNEQEIKNYIFKEMSHFNWEKLKVRYNHDDDKYRKDFSVAVEVVLSDIQTFGLQEHGRMVLSETLVQQLLKYIKLTTEEVVSFLVDVFPRTAIERIASSKDVRNNLDRQGNSYSILAEHLKNGLSEGGLKKIVKLLKTPGKNPVMQAVDIDNHRKLSEGQMSNILLKERGELHPMRVPTNFVITNKRYPGDIQTDPGSLLESDSTMDIEVNKKICKLKRAELHPMRGFPSFNPTAMKVESSDNNISEQLVTDQSIPRIVASVKIASSKTSPTPLHQVGDRKCADGEVSSSITSLPHTKTTSESIDDSNLEGSAPHYHSCNDLQAADIRLLDETIKKAEQALQLLKQKLQQYKNKINNPRYFEDLSQCKNCCSSALTDASTISGKSSHGRFQKTGSVNCKSILPTASKEHRTGTGTKNYVNILSPTVNERSEHSSVEYIGHLPLPDHSVQTSKPGKRRASEMKETMARKKLMYLSSSSSSDSDVTLIESKISNSTYRGNDTNEDSDCDTTFHTAIEFP